MAPIEFLRSRSGGFPLGESSEVDPVPCRSLTGPRSFPAWAVDHYRELSIERTSSNALGRIADVVTVLTVPESLPSGAVRIH